MSTPEIMQGDCREVMKSLPAGKFDLIVTSPPYNAEKEYEDNLGVEEYRKFAQEWCAEIPRLLSDTGSFWLNVGYMRVGENSTLPLTYLYHPLVNLPMVQEIIWKYEGGMTYKNRFTHRTERWMWFAKDPAKCYFDLDGVRDRKLNKTVNVKNHPLGKNPTDCWEFNHVTAGSSEKLDHPCQFPEAMIARIIKACSPRDGYVLDPFSGSGTTATVATAHHRNAVGIEMDEKYIDLSLSRIGKVIALEEAGNMFEEGVYEELTEGDPQGTPSDTSLLSSVSRAHGLQLDPFEAR